MLASLDVLAGQAELAAERGYCRPRIVEEATLNIVEGRHPVLDQILPPGTVVPNGTRMSAGGGAVSANYRT